MIRSEDYVLCFSYIELGSFWRKLKDAFKVRCLWLTDEDAKGCIMVQAAILWESLSLMIVSHGCIAARTYVTILQGWGHPLDLVIFPNFMMIMPLCGLLNNCRSILWMPVKSDSTVFCQTLDVNVTKSLSEDLEHRVISTFSPPSSLKILDSHLESQFPRPSCTDSPTRLVSIP